MSKGGLSFTHRSFGLSMPPRLRRDVACRASNAANYPKGSSGMPSCCSHSAICYASGMSHRRKYPRDNSNYPREKKNYPRDSFSFHGDSSDFLRDICYCLLEMKTHPRCRKREVGDGLCFQLSSPCPAFSCWWTRRVRLFLQREEKLQSAAFAVAHGDCARVELHRVLHD